MMSALSEQGSFEEQQQRLYQLASSMGLPGPGQSTGSVFVGVCTCHHPHCHYAGFQKPLVILLHLGVCTRWIQNRGLTDERSRGIFPFTLFQTLK